MKRQVAKGIRLSASVIKRIERVTAEEHSTFSQFIRTAAVNELKRREALIGKVVAA
jgi:hypothetical protein